SFICGSIWFAKDENTQPSSIKYLDEVSDFLLRSIISTKSEGSVYLKDIISENFDYPKPVSLIETLLFSFSNKNALILDSFAGSGTTAHAVLKLNAQDGGNRRFILCEMMDYAESITAERVRRVMEGYGEGNKKVEGLGGSFDFYELGDALFSESGLLNESVGIKRIRQYIAYSESIPLDNQLP
ncbi:site-specific DNA-methyltransferase, partial [Acinetobacter baumannii]|nr:site-specific DNA-methyltransferase [Acinetobacter baumannii]